MLFLSKVKKESPGLFWCLVIFCFLQVSFTLIKLEVTPFFLYGMYSEKIKTADTVSIYIQKVNGRLLNLNDIHLREGIILATCIENYHDQLLNNKKDIVDTRIMNKYPGIYNSRIFQGLKKYIMNDSTSLDRFLSWYEQKLQQYLVQDIKTIEVIKQTYKENSKQNNFQLLSAERIFYIE